MNREEKIERLRRAALLRKSIGETERFKQFYEGVSLQYRISMQERSVMSTRQLQRLSGIGYTTCSALVTGDTKETVPGLLLLYEVARALGKRIVFRLEDI